MPRGNFHSDKAEQFVVRLPDGLRNVIFEAAAKNGRSMNSEIVARIQDPAGSLTRREHFAGLALQGLLADSNVNGSYGELTEAAVHLSDALIAELSKGGDA